MTKAPLMTPVLIGGCFILMLSFAIRASFGMFQIPIATEFGWPRADFSMAIAIQNLAWGIGQPVFGALAERFGDRRTIILGALFYATGLVLSSFAVTPGAHQLLNILIGFGIAGTGFGVILAVVGRAASAENRSVALGVATAAGSAGQVFGAPAAELLMQVYPWQTVFVIFAVVILLALLFLPLLSAPERATKQQLEDSLGTVLRRAFRDPSYTLIFAGFSSDLGDSAVVEVLQTMNFPGTESRGRRRQSSRRVASAFNRPRAAASSSRSRIRSPPSPPISPKAAISRP